MSKNNPVRAWLRKRLPKTARHRFILGFEKWKSIYDKGVAVIASVRLVEITDVAILMGAVKYIFGDHLSMWWVIAVGLVYYPGRTLLYLLIGWFWESNDGWRIQAEVSGKRCMPGRVMLVNPDGKEYGMEELAREIALASKKIKEEEGK